jgi:hypothetical protein
MTNKPQPQAKQSHSDPHKDGRDQYKRHIDGDITVRGQIETHVPPSAAEQHEAERKEDKRRDKNSFIVGVLTLIFVIIYAGLTALQVWVTRVQFHKDQRPYVWIIDYNVGGSIHIVEQDKMWINLSLVNYGKSPALHLRSAGKVFVGKDAMQQADKWFDGFDNGTTDYMEGETLLPPVIPSDPAKHFTYFTSFSDAPLTSDDINYILHTDQPVAMVLKLNYTDLDGKSYSSEVCMSRALNGSIPHCHRHNAME